MDNWPKPGLIKRPLPNTTRDTEPVENFYSLYARWALDQETSIHQRVENAYRVTLVMAFTPQAAGLVLETRQHPRATLAIALSLAV